MRVKYVTIQQKCLCGTILCSSWPSHDHTWSSHDHHTISIIDEDPLNHFSDGGSGEESGEDEDDDEGDLIIDERVLQKDFIVDKYTLACLYYNKVGGHP